jgi:hypothetical protein
MFFRAELADLDFAAGPESLEVQLFDEADIPWDELAFRTVGRTLECFFADRAPKTTRFAPNRFRRWLSLPLADSKNPKIKDQKIAFGSSYT